MNTDTARQTRYRAGPTYAARTDTPEWRAAQAEKMRKWRSGPKGQAWLAKQRQKRADLRARKLAVLKKAGLA
jgi:hypothetical protein